jgi:hypothetical protein
LSTGTGVGWAGAGVGVAAGVHAASTKVIKINKVKLFLYIQFYPFRD